MAGEPQPTRLAYQPQLDGLRALSVLAVIAYHSHSRLGHGGFLGVDVFFVLSGFLITTLLLQEHEQSGRIGLQAFYGRRVRRLLPALVLVLAVTAAVYWLLQVGGHRYTDATLGEAAAALFYVVAWLKAFRVGGYGALTHTWSLSVEEHFYLVWPFVAAVAVRRRWKLELLFPVLAVAAAGYVAVLALRHTDYVRMYFAPDTRAYGLLCGAALAAIDRRAGRRARTRGSDVAFAVAVAYMAGLLLVAGFSWRPYYLGAGAGFVVCSAVVVRYVVAFADTAPARLLSWSPLVWIGRRSYGIYLWQVPVITFFDFELRRLHGLRIVPALAVTFGAAALSYRFVERPLLSRRRPVSGFASVQG